MFHVDIILFSCFVNLNKCELTTKTCFENNPLILCEPIFKGTSVYWRSYKYALCLCSNIIRGPLSCRLIHLHLIIMVLPSFISLLNLLIVFSLATVLIMGNSSRQTKYFLDGALYSILFPAASLFKSLHQTYFKLFVKG